jgi:hypothetical protein
MRGPLRFMLGAPPIARDPLYRAAGQVPAFDLRVDRGSIVDVIGGITPTFTRPSSVQTVWTGAGFTDFAADVPAFAVDPATGRTGYVHNPAATNLFLNSATPATQSFTVTAQAYTLSFYGTGTITLSGASTAGPLVGTGAAPNRVSLTFTPTAGTLTLTLSGSIVRPQLETGTAATSPITTGGSAVARSGDVLTVSGVPFSSFYNQLGGTWYAELSRTANLSGRFPTIISVNDGTAANTIVMFLLDFASRYSYSITTASAAQVGFNQSADAAAGLIHKVAMRSLENDGALASNGAITGADTAIAMPTVNQLSIGTSPLGQMILYRLAYFPPGPAQARIQQLTV